MSDLRPRGVLWLTLGTVATTLFGIVQYHRAMLAGFYVSRVDMAAVGVEVLLGTVTIAGSLIALAKRRPWITPAPIAYRGRIFVNASTAAFIVGMLAYLIIYPPTPWVFDTATALAFALGIMLTLPIGRADIPPVVTLLNAGAGLAACAAGFVLASGLLVIVGMFVGVGAVGVLTATAG
jgi:proton-translocating NAD(P)+ transhydrogenase subunit beta